MNQINELTPRKNPKQSRSTKTVDVILSAAAHILGSSGYSDYSTNAIARKAGVSIGSLYQYFPSKDSITVALILRETALVTAKIEQASVSNISWQNALEIMIEIAANHQMSKPNLARMLDVEEMRLKVRGNMESIQYHLEMVLKRELASQVDLSIADLSRDIISITKAITDTASHDKENATTDLKHRLSCAVIGYVSYMMKPREQRESEAN